MRLPNKFEAMLATGLSAAALVAGCGGSDNSTANYNGLYLAYSDALENTTNYCTGGLPDSPGFAASSIGNYATERAQMIDELDLGPGSEAETARYEDFKSDFMPANHLAKKLFDCVQAEIQDSQQPLP